MDAWGVARLLVEATGGMDKRSLTMRKQSSIRRSSGGFDENSLMVRWELDDRDRPRLVSARERHSQPASHPTSSNFSCAPLILQTQQPDSNHRCWVGGSASTTASTCLPYCQIGRRRWEALCQLIFQICMFEDFIFPQRL
jgi:hypothetical protein